MAEAHGSTLPKGGVNTGKNFQETADRILSKNRNKHVAAAAAEAMKKQPGVIILSATYIVAIEIGDGPDERRQHIVQLVNGKGYTDASKDDAVSLIFFTEPPAKASDDENQMKGTIERLSTHLKGVCKAALLEDHAAVGGTKNK